MRTRLLIAETIRFIWVAIGFGLVTMLVVGALWLGGAIYDRIHNGVCIADVSLGGYCLIDTFLLTGLLVVGWSAGLYFLRLALQFLLKALAFLETLWRLATWSERQLNAVIAEREFQRLRDLEAASANLPNPGGPASPDQMEIR